MRKEHDYFRKLPDPWVGLTIVIVVSAVSFFMTPTPLVRQVAMLFVLALNVVLRVYLLRDVWARVVGSTTVYRLEAAANVSAKGDLANALGEGFADGLDVAGF